MTVRNDIAVRTETPDDIDAIRRIDDRAFGRTDEGQLVGALRARGAITLSLVATVDERITGHLLYSPVSVDGGNEASAGAGLGPIAVVPEYQRQGIGTRLIDAGNQMIRAAGFPLIVVLGHPSYYPRFGFEPASRYGLRCQWDVPDEAFMVRIFDLKTVGAVRGLVRYRPEFSELA